MKIAAVVVTYNRKRILQECLNAVLSQTQTPDSIIIIDNASTDGTRELIEKKYLKNKKIVYKNTGSNVGGAGGFYEGIKMANRQKCDWIWIMDDDVIPEKDALKNLVRAQEKIKEKISFLASTVHDMRGRIMNTPGIDLAPSANGYQDWHKHILNYAVKIQTATFVSLLLNNKAVNAVGYPVKDYFIWGDDTEYTMRMTRNFAPAYLIGDSIVVHKRKQSRTLSIVEENEPNRIRVYFYLFRNTLINHREYYGRKAAYAKIRDDRNLIKIIKKDKSCLYKKEKIAIIKKAHRAFLFHKFNLRAFNDRFNKNVNWDEK